MNSVAGSVELHSAATPTCALVGTPLAGTPLAGTPLALASKGLDACVHCGFCLQACPTYVNLEDENDSPRGRLVLMRRMLEGAIALNDPTTAQHIDRCLGCRACETACPSGVPYGDLLEATRATMASARTMPFVARAMLAVFKHPLLLRTALLGARAFRATRLPHLLARILPARLAFPMAMIASTTPTNLRARSARSPSRHTTPTASSTFTTPSSTFMPTTATCLTGCVMSGLFSHVNRATERVLMHNGFPLRTTSGQGCCGALHAHAGDLESARALARINVAAFEQSGADVIAVNSAGCGAMLKQYGHLLHDDPAWAERAERVSARTRDIAELLATVGPTAGTASVGLRVTHDPPCHQMHAQRVVSPPLAVLRAIPGLSLIPLEDADQCCGSAGIYNLVEPATSDAVLAPKLARIAESGADWVATGNPGCMMQIGAGLLRSGSRVRVVHPIELLDASYEHGT